MSEIPPYERGLHDLGEGCHAWLQPPGGWGLANSGVVVGADDVLVVDTQNDVPLARALQAAVHGLVGRTPVGTVVNSHSDGDHWVGNMLFEDSRILASQATVSEMRSMWLDPARLSDLAGTDTAFGRFVQWRIDTFDYTGWRPVYPTESFSGEMHVQAAGRQVRLLEVGPAHTRGDTIVHLPAAGVVYAGDILFTGSTPIMWTGPLSRCVAACERILELGPRLVVPGHGPVVDAAGVVEVRDYLQFILDYATDQFQAGNTPEQAYAALQLGPYAAWPHASRAYQNIRLVYSEQDPQAFSASLQQSLDVVLSDDDGQWATGSPARLHAHPA